MQIKVADCPFVITQWEKHSTPQGDAIEVCSNLDHKAILSEQHPLAVIDTNEEPQLTVTLHRGLTAKVHRNVYYQWIELAQEQQINNQTHLVIQSAGENFSLGRLD